jgi:hypothetical protein
MPASEVLNSILDDFTAKKPELVSDQLKAFCEYAAAWLATNSIVGVGHTQNGLSLRFADGRELLLFEPLPELVIPVPGDFSITGGQNKITKPAAGDTPSFQITGR